MLSTDYIWQTWLIHAQVCCLLHTAALRSVCYFMLSAGWYLLTAIATCCLLTTDRLKPTHICCLLHTAALSWVTWCWMRAYTCCLLLPPAVCSLTDACLLMSEACFPAECSVSVAFLALLLPADLLFLFTNGKRHSVHYWVMDARGRLLSTKEAEGSHDTIANLPSASPTQKYIAVGFTMIYFIT